MCFFKENFLHKPENVVEWERGIARQSEEEQTVCLVEQGESVMLSKLLEYNPITIQCHDNPDADAIASGYALYSFFESYGKDVSLIYSGMNKIQKSNLVLMQQELQIPIKYYGKEEQGLYFPGLLITVDCQYGAGNVTKFEADEIAIIDHHQIESPNVPLSLIQPALGSCSTIVWDLLSRAGYKVTDEKGVGTALYYGLFTDTNQFSELHNPLDRDALDDLPFDKSQITMFKNSNISFNELEVASAAMQGYHYEISHKYAVIRSQPCDPNILGIISDFLLQVDGVDSCVVFNENGEGYKLSVRSCMKEINAKDLVVFLCDRIGSGGGHYEKAGGFISKKLLRDKYGDYLIEDYIRERMEAYFEMFEVIYASTYEADFSTMKMYQKKQIPIGYVKADEMLPVGTPITVRTMEGDFDLSVEEDLYIIIGVNGEVYTNRKEKFENSYITEDIPYVYEECVLTPEYVPHIKNRLDGSNLLLTDYAKRCRPAGIVKIYAKQLEKGVKVFPVWDKEHYMTGKVGDYLAVRSDDLHDAYIIERVIFGKTYEPLDGVSEV